jgi:hypothetical protein
MDIDPSLSSMDTMDVDPALALTAPGLWSDEESSHSAVSDPDDESDTALDKPQKRKVLPVKQD